MEICLKLFMAHEIHTVLCLRYNALTGVITVYECLPGADRVMNIIEDMTGQKPSVFFKLCWKFIIPLLSLVSEIFSSSWS